MTAGLEKPTSNYTPARRGHITAATRARATRMLLVLLAFVLVAPLVPYALAYMGPSNNPNPGTDLWREVRQREVPAEGMEAGVPAAKQDNPVQLFKELYQGVSEREAPATGRTQVQGVDAPVLINRQGEDWRLFRMEKLVPLGAWVLAGIIAVIVVFYLFRGRIQIEGGRSGITVERFNPTQLVVHWFVAGLFVLLGITGLVLLYGRFVLIPLLGPEGFSVTASACKEAHNLFGPIFPFAVLAVFIYYVKGNGFRWVDVKWFLKGGGLFSKHGHAPSERFNAGQKVWFWLIVLLGTVISISGFVLDFPNFGQSRQLMELAHFSHGVVAIAFIAASLGHIYIGTVGMEGALEAMTTGRVDANWAKEHHDLWYQEMERQGLVNRAQSTQTELAEEAVPDVKG